MKNKWLKRGGVGFAIIMSIKGTISLSVIMVAGGGDPVKTLAAVAFIGGGYALCRFSRRRNGTQLSRFVRRKFARPPGVIPQTVRTRPPVSAARSSRISSAVYPDSVRGR